MKKKDKRLKENKNILTDKQINDIGEKIGKENFKEGEGGDLGRTLRLPIDSDTVKSYILRSSLGYIYAFQHPEVMGGKFPPIHTKVISAALKLSELHIALEFKMKLETHICIKYDVLELEQDLKVYPLSSTSLSLAK